MDKHQFRLLSPQEKHEVLTKLPKRQRQQLLRNPDLFLFPRQVIDGQQRYTLLRCGRRFGKSWSGGAWIAKLVFQGARTLGLCGPTYNDVHNIMVPAIQRWFHGIDKPKFNNLHKRIEFSDKSEFRDVTIYCFTSDKEIRGYSLEALWCDEVGSWLGNSEQIKQRFYSIDTCVSAGYNPQTIITTTPITIPLFHEWKRAIDSGDRRYRLITGTMFDNPYLTDQYRESEVKKYGQTRLGRQEIYGEQLAELEGALFTKAAIDRNRTQLTRVDCSRVLIAVDPAITSTSQSDETGIIVMGLTGSAVESGKTRAVVLADLSGRYTPKEWAEVVANAFQQYQADYITAERNQGGDLVASNLTAANPLLQPFIKTIHATKSKKLRAEPVSNVLDDDRILFSGEFPELEQQMIEYVGTGSSSPDRMDAFVYGATELLIKNQDLDVFLPIHPLSPYRQIFSIPPQFVRLLGLDIRPESTNLVLARYNKQPRVDQNIYLDAIESGPMTLNQVIQRCREILRQSSEPIYISCNAEYAEELSRFHIPAKPTIATDALIESINRDIQDDLLRINPSIYLQTSRLLKTFQYDGEALEKTGRHILMQHEGFIQALLNAYSRSHHRLHIAAKEKRKQSFEEEIFAQLKRERNGRHV